MGGVFLDTANRGQVDTVAPDYGVSGNPLEQFAGQDVCGQSSGDK